MLTGIMLAGIIAVCLLAGCVTVTRTLPDGSRVTASATGNGNITIAPDGMVTAQARQTETVYSALGGIVGQLAEKGAKGAVEGAKPVP